MVQGCQSVDLGRQAPPNYPLRGPIYHLKALNRATLGGLGKYGGSREVWDRCLPGSQKYVK